MLDGLPPSEWDARCFKELFCSICEYRTCDACFVPEFSRFLVKAGEYERCILCRKPTPYRLTDPVQARRHYVDGAGQMCPACHAQVYGEKN